MGSRSQQPEPIVGTAQHHSSSYCKPWKRGNSAEKGYIYIYIYNIYICIFILLLWYSVAQNHKDGLSGSSSMMVVYMDHKAWVEFGVSLGFRV